MDDVLKICSANCQGLGKYGSYTNKRRDVFKYLKNKKFDIYFIQDTHFTPNCEKYIRAEWGYEGWFNSFSSNSRGVAILFNNTFEFQMKQTYSDNSGNFIILRVTINSKEYVLINIYAPNRDDPDFFRNINHILNGVNCDNIIIGGDWNLLLDPHKDGYNYKNINNSNAREEVTNLYIQHNLTDIWRHLNPTLKQYTWHKKNNKKIIQQGRLDFFLVTETMINKYTKSNIKPGYRSDHSMITLELKASSKIHTKTFWKFNSTLLKDKEYIQSVKDVIHTIKLEYMPLCYTPETIANLELFQPNISDQLFLEVLLMKIRSMTLRFSAQKKKNNINTEIKLTKEIEELEENMRDNCEEIATKREELEHIRKEKLMGAFIRSRANWIENGEKPTQYFCGLENRHFTNKRMDVLINKNGMEITNDEEIVEETKRFYENLYTSKEDELLELDSTFSTLIETRLSDEEALDLEGEIKIKELADCLKLMKNNKSPGSDGFTVEFFKFFWKDFKHFICNSLNEAYRVNRLSVTQREGVIVCIPKGDKSRKYLKNWRPICLLNVLYKLCSGCIANRIKKILPQIIHEDQTGFIKNRFIGDNIRLTYDIIQYINRTNNTGMLLLIDFEKAFDSVAWKFIFKTLDLFNFKSDIKNWIRLFLNNSMKSCIIVNRKVSKWFSINRGCRQGDPLSPYIFTLCVEVLALMIRNNRMIKGIFIGDREFKLSQYADDTTFFLDGSKQSFEYCVSTVLEYAKFSGLNMNFDKTKVINLGESMNNKHIYMPHLPLEWDPDTFTILGIEFNKNLHSLLDLNLNRKMQLMLNIMKSWENRNLTTLGKITVIKTLVISKVTHILMTLPVEQSKTLDQLEKIFLKFIWNGKNDKIKRNTVYKPIPEGGLNMVNIKIFQQALHITWIRRLFNQNPASWKSIINQECPAIDKIKYYGPLYCNRYINLTKNMFWVNVLQSFKQYATKYSASNRIEQYKYEPLFYNNRLKIDPNLNGSYKLQSRGVYLLHQMINWEEKRLMTRQEVNSKYSTNIDFISIAHITQIIKNDLEKVNWINDGGICRNENNTTSFMHNIQKDEKGTKRIYSELLYNVNHKEIQKRWNKYHLHNLDFERIFNVIHKSLSCTRLKWLQIRITYKILTTNKSVAIYDNNQTPLCTFCAEKEEDICHLFYDCKIVRKFWQQLEQEISTKCRINQSVKFPKELIIFAFSPLFHSCRVLDIILLMAKMYIYKQKVNNNKNLHLAPFLLQIKQRYEMESYNATISHNTNRLDREWFQFKNLVVVT